MIHAVETASWQELALAPAALLHTHAFNAALLPLRLGSCMTSNAPVTHFDTDPTLNLPQAHLSRRLGVPEGALYAMLSQQLQDPSPLCTIL